MFFLLIFGDFFGLSVFKLLFPGLHWGAGNFLLL